MKKTLLTAVIGFILFNCSTQKDDLQTQLEQRTRTELVNALKAPDSYKPGSFRITSEMNNKAYIGASDVLYNQKGFKVINEKDTIWDGVYNVTHIYLSKNAFGTEMKGMIRAVYDSHLNLLLMRDWSDDDERFEVKRLKDLGLETERLAWN